MICDMKSFHDITQLEARFLLIIYLVYHASILLFVTVEKLYLASN